MIKKLFPWMMLILFALVLIWFWQKQIESAQQTVDFAEADYVGSAECKDCHKNRHRSWYDTYHRTMTQEASDLSVLGDFNGQPQTYWGYTIRPINKDGRYYFSYYDANNQEFLNEIEIKRTVGSRRYQQYLAQTENTDGNYYRLELLWHIEDQRWIHLNGAFLDSDDQSFSQHTGIWNQNCIFCHNTGIKPGMNNYNELVERSRAGEPVNVFTDARFDSAVTELGISCESCHAPAKIHSQLSQNPFRKYYFHFTEKQDPSIVHPNELDQQAALSVCGQCHGQRVPENLDMAKIWMESGPTFRPGQDLEKHVNPVWQDTQIQSQQPDIFATRFWADGTPRLTAYEYQGIVQSACLQDNSFTCNSCHNMHGGDPKGMIEPENRTNQACLTCHQDMVESPEAHTGHDVDGAGSLCYDCHMPKMTYGIMTFHRNHRIESPVSHQELSIEKPNACVACHLNETDEWLYQQSANLWQQPLPSDSHGMIQSLVELHSGDPVQRALSAYQMGQHFESLPAKSRLFLIPHLLLALEDSYPAIRRFAHKSLVAIINESAAENFELDELSQLKESLMGFDFIADQNIRAKVILNTKAWYKQVDFTKWPEPPVGSLLYANYSLQMDVIDTLRQEAASIEKRIHVGE
ncbi:ammonia-forming cytochrome c nitrite reductase subunit c552 [Marinicella litoralis]|uniref:Putative CXXCH cytochrome family protein n=1 Tax=Marinicella litoralis TaxID=644220 RepID=A0A4R6XDQ3_9GAMM|nr:ammonia-forming cytochrome c nitrite reductase subunit c552 [Marinicella litoralis]TDR17436.1 putative CXXCH cytochrome family protein [Marinicella litoralis]